MRVLVNARHSAPAVAHGGPIMARRHAEALHRHGAQVLLVAPEPANATDAAELPVAGYAADREPSAYLRTLRPNARAEAAIEGIIDSFRPDVLYDVAGPVWGVAASARRGVPIVSSVASYTWYCPRDFLVDSNAGRCTGPESPAKCYECETRKHPFKRRLVEGALRQLHAVGSAPQWTRSPRLAPYRIWAHIEESRLHLRQLRSRVDCFVTGDRQARAFFLEHGIAPEKITNIPQCLPADALIERRVAMAGIPGRDRPLALAFVGRLDVEKGFHVLARAFESMPESAPVALSVVHVADATVEKVAPMFSDARRFRAKLESGAITLCRPESKEELYTLMARADVGVVPSIAYESPSLAMMELAAQRTPIVRSESGGMDHVIQDRVNGRTFPYGDHGALGNVIAEILSDPAVLDRWRERLPRIENDAVYAARLIEVFEAVVAKRHAPAPSLTK